MNDNNDWRLCGQEAYLADAVLYRRAWKAPSVRWDHDHCAFCWAKFSEYADDLHEGYTTNDNHHWVCPECFEDFSKLFRWTVMEGDMSE